MTRPPPPRYDWKGFLLLCGIYLVVVLLWRTPWVLPLQLLVVLLHELSHGVAAVLTGGRIAEIQVFADQGGHCVTAGGIPAVVVSAGYLGSLLFGVVLLLTATRTRASPLVSALLGIALALTAIRFMPAGTFGQWFAAIWGIVLVGFSALPRGVSEMALRIVAVTSCLYAILDIKADVLDQDHPASDAARLEEITGVPAFIWGVFWIGISIAVTAIAARRAIDGEAAARRLEPAAR